MTPPAGRTAVRKPAMFVVTLPWATLCPDNRRAALHVRNGRMRIGLSDRYRAAKEAAATLALVAARSWQDGPIPANWNVALRVVIYPPDNRRRDLTNHVKLLADALNGIAYEDDSQITRALLLRMDTDRTNPRAVVSVWCLAPRAGDGP